MTEVPKCFNDVEESTILRVLYDFSLVDSNGKPVELDDLGIGNPPATLTGTIVEPLPLVYKDKLVEMLISAPLANSQSGNVATFTSLPPMDWNSLSIGSNIDGYCTKTMKWFEGKIMDMAKIDGEAASFKVHFKSWNSKHDEWIDRGSPRLLPFGSMTQKTPTSVPLKREYVPWYENTAIYEKLEKVVGKIPTRNTMEIMINTIDDWCVDFTYPNPSLWLIDSSADIWYRVCGPLVPGGGYAHPTYAPTFDPYIERYAAAAHVAFCLIDFYPLNKKLSLSDVTAEVTARSGGRVDQAVIYQNCDFIYEQVASLSHPDDWDKLFSFDKSLCMVQLKKKSEVLKRPTKQNSQALHKAFAPGVPKSLLDMSAGGVFGVGDENVMIPLGKNSLIGDPIGTERNTKGKPVLLEERDLVKLLEARDNRAPAFPDRAVQGIETLLQTSSITKDKIPSVLKVWSVLTNFKGLLNLPHISLEDFVHLLEVESSGPSMNYLWADPTSTHPFLREIHIALLVPLVLDRPTADSFTRVVYTPPAAPPRALDSFFDKPVITAPTINSVTIWETLGRGSHPVTEKEIAHILRAGDTWVEVTRLLLTEKIDGIFAPEYIDPVGEFLALLTTLVASPHAQHFTHEGVSCVPEDSNRFSFSCPDDFTCILEDIRNGIFERGAIVSPGDEGGVVATDQIEPSEECAVLDQYDFRIEVDGRVDAYCSTLRVWSMARIVCILPIDMGESSSLVQVTFDGWEGMDETYGSGSSFLAPPQTFSEDLEVKHLHPDHIAYEKTYQLIKKFKEKKLDHGLRDVREDSAETILGRVRAVFDKAHEVCKSLPDNSDLFKATVALQQEFEGMYSARIKPKRIKYETNISKASEISNVVSFISTNEYRNMSVDMKIELLEWLCNEMMSSGAAKKYLEEALEKKIRFEKETKQRKPEAAHVVGNTASESFRVLRGKRGLEVSYTELDEEIEASDNESSKSSYRRKSAKLKPSSTEIGMVSAVADVPDEPVSPDDEMLEVDMRMEPIGKDRNGTLYWLLPNDSKPLRIFCEMLGTQSIDSSDRSTQWKILLGEENIREVADWLSEFGQNESLLKVRLHDILDGSKEKERSSTGSDVVTADRMEVVESTEPVVRPDLFLHHVYHPCWFNKEMYFHLHELNVALNAKGQMEVGVKDLDGRIIITAYKYSEAHTSCTKDAGGRIGDQIVAVGSNAVRDVGSLQSALKAAVDNTSVRVLILRHANPLNLRVFRLMYNLEADLKTLVASETQGVCTSDDQIHLKVDPSTEKDKPTRICGMIVQMLFCSRSHVVASNEWVSTGITKWISRISQCWHSISARVDISSSRGQMIDCLKMCLLEIENVFYISRRALSKDWTADRFRFRWRNACTNANTFAKVSMAAVSLYRVVNWESIEKMSLGMDRTLWQQLVPAKTLRTYVPVVNERVIFYPDGELALREQMTRLGLAEFPPSVGVIESKGKTLHCIVRGIKHFSGGPSNQPLQCYPFYRVELQVVHSPPEKVGNVPTISICENDRIRQTRIFNRILNVLYSLPEASPFVSPVHEGDAPDYYTVVTSPMHLTEMTRKAKYSLYLTLDSFLEDVGLIRSNCVLYCTDRYPALIPLADTLYNTAANVVEKLRFEFCGKVTTMELEAMQDISSGSQLGDVVGQDLGSRTAFEGCTPNTQTLLQPISKGTVEQGDLLSAHVPLHRGICEQDYVIDMTRYANACSRPRYVTEDRVCWKRVRDARFLPKDTPDVDTIFGSIRGCNKPPPNSSLLPWNWLQVEWDLLEDQFFDINPWEINLMVPKDTGKNKK